MRLYSARNSAVVAAGLLLCMTVEAAVSNNQYQYQYQQQQQLQHQQQLQYQQQQQQQTNQFAGASYPAGTPSYNTAAATSSSTAEKDRKPFVAGSGGASNKEDGVLDRFNHRYPDGSYEFRYELGDGTTRYERGYFLLYDKVKTLVVVGYYSYRMPDGRYVTVFYNADQNGYRQNQSITSQTYPNLPRTIEVPKFKSDAEYSIGVAATTSAPSYFAATTARGSGRF